MESIGKYKVIRELGAGGFGAVYLAEDEKWHERVAIKVFRPKQSIIDTLSTGSDNTSTGSDKEAVDVLKERFLNEAKILRQLGKSPYIVDIFDFDTLTEGAPYYVMPYLPDSLKKNLGSDATDINVIAELAPEDKPKSLPLNRAVTIIEQLLIAISTVHKAGIVHRDITTANVLLDEHQDVKVCDFGIAKMPDFAGSTSNVVMGNGDYRSPEQKQSTKHVDPRSDVYSIGVVIYRMLCGTMPQGRYQDPQHYNREISNALNEFIITALETNKQQRFADATAMLSQFKGIKDSLSGTITDEGGTDVDDGSVPNIKPQLKPLQQKIEHILRKEGQIGDKHNLSLQAMASVAGLSEAELEDFVAVTEKQLGSELTPFRNWLDFVESQAKTHEGKLDSTTMDVLLEAGQPLGKDTDTLREHINGVCGRYLSPDNTVKPPSEKPKTAVEPKPAFQPKSKTVPKSTTNNDPKMGHTKTETPPRLASKPGNSATQDHTNTYQRRNTTLLAGLGAVVAVGVGIWLYSGKSTLSEDKTYEVNGTSFMLKAIPGGSFQMGSNNGGSDEKPVHRVSIKPFRLMETEVTWAMYQPCIDEGVCTDNQDKGGDEGWGKGNRPVINVSWNNITQEYIPWLNKQTGQTFRLPTEAQWEYAARAATTAKETTTKYSWGDSISCSQARYGNYDGDCGNDRKTVPVKSFSPNAFGLYDMHGNVWEWLQDCWNDSYNGAPGNGSAWMQGDCGRAVLRGGSWHDVPVILRSADRGWSLRSIRNGSVGFRLAQGE